MSQDFHQQTQQDLESPQPYETTPSQPMIPDGKIIKTSFYPTQAQLDKLDDFAAEYNKRYRRLRRKIDRQDIIRFLIDESDFDMITKLEL